MPHLTEGVFPITRGSTWLGDAAQLPPEIRGDRDELPLLSLPPDGSQKDLADALAAHAAEFGRLRLAEERRLLYVALTRAERVLLLSGHHWGASTAKPAGPSEFLRECAELARGWVQPDEWAPAPDPDRPEPAHRGPENAQLAASTRWVPAATAVRAAPTGCWPRWRAPASTSRGPSPTSGDRADAAIGAGLDLDEPAIAGRGGRRWTARRPEPAEFDPFGWAADVTTLLAERATGEQRGSIEVDLPGDPFGVRARRTGRRSAAVGPSAASTGSTRARPAPAPRYRLSSVARAVLSRRGTAGRP